ncbi:hypothetical protein GOBAR_AA14692 [Gossypium barbadense]|uniref:Uncharacterized protein n=1 Tax=Gossypium barbadense TaxID=3634 RepID=A0A2P5XRI7_GOSBA|nr:hypothetical protein GOBAR_AA14692 [Gossypium barbadense]
MDFAVSANNSGSTSEDSITDSEGVVQLNLLGASSEKNNGGFLEEEFTLLDGNAVTEVIEGVPSITFSNRVQEFIQQ